MNKHETNISEIREECLAKESAVARAHCWEGSTLTGKSSSSSLGAYPNKIKLLKIWEMLNADSDENNPLSTRAILSRLEDDGIFCDRRTLYKDIETLINYGYEVMCDLREHTNHYYVSERGFNVPELKILMDAVTAANFISTKKSKELHNKIAALAGSNRAELLKKSQDAVNLTKSENESVYYVINELDNAILEGKKVSFEYFDFNIMGERINRRDGARYITNPLRTVVSGDRYYLVAYSEEREMLIHYRIDRMQLVKIEDEAVVMPGDVNLAEHKKQLFSMYAGESVRAAFEVDNSLIDVIFDKFGAKTILKDIGGNRFIFSADVQISPTLIGWCLSFGNKLRVKSPTKLVEAIQDSIKEATTLYKTE